MELLISVEDAERRAADLAVTADPADSVGELADGLAAALSQPRTEWTIRCARRGILLDPAVTIDDSGIRTGDRLLLAPAGANESYTTTRPQSRYLLVVTGGPAAGARIPLDSGSFVIGRSDDADLPINDVAMSRRHATFDIGSRLELTDLGSTNGTYVDGERLVPRARRSVNLDDQLELGDTIAHLELAGGEERPIRLEHGSLRFNRPPRVFKPYDGRKFQLPAPPTPPGKNRLPWVSALVPLLMAIVMLGLSQVTGSGGFQIFSLIFFLMTPLMVVGSYLEAKRSGRLDYRSAVGEFETRLAGVSADVDAERQREAEQRRAEAPDPAACRRLVDTLDPHLWERSSSDADFASVRLGTSQLPSLNTIERSPSPPTEFDARLDEAERQSLVVGDVPLLADLRIVGGIGIAGEPAIAADVGRWLVLQLATLHSPTELVIAGMVGDSGHNDWDWMKWLPHTRSATSPLDGAHLARGRANVRDAAERLTALVLRRQGVSVGHSDAPPQTPVVVVLIHESAEIDLTALTPILEAGPACGVYPLWVGSESSQIPRPCGAVVTVPADPALPASRVGFRGGAQHDDVLVDRVNLESATAWARALAPLSDAARRQSRDGSIPRSVSLVSILGDDDSILTDPSVVLARWEYTDTSLVAAVGKTATDLFSMDLRTDGPHGLVGGTTGSGKSEFLQTLVASLAATYPPSVVNFILIDYKGGAAFKECVNLPHTAGFVTDLDGHLVERARVSLAAELRHREELLSRLGAKDLADMRRDHPDQAPPSLVIVIDEFAALVTDVPEFVAAVIDLAQRGRSLGVHLVLATQSPGQVVSQAVRDNASLRVALRVQNADASQAVIDSPIASSLPDDVPGRAIARLGGRDLVEFQAAFAGGRSIGVARKIPLTIAPFGLGTSARSPSNRQTGADDSGPTDLMRLTEAISSSAAIAGLPVIRRPWLPPLPPLVDLATLPPSSDHLLVIGMRDVPAQQRQEPFVVDLAADGNFAIFGAGGSGRTTALRTTAAAATGHTSPDSLAIYGIDAGGRGLAVLAELPHTGSVVDAADEERVTRLVRLLQAELRQRGERFSAAHVANIDEYRATAPGEPIPRIVVLVDNLPALISAYDVIDGGAVVDTLEALLKDGRAAGIHFVVTADRPPSSNIGTAFPRRLVMRLASEAEYATFGIPTRIVDFDPPPGRGVIDGNEVQLAAVSGIDGPTVGAFSALAATRTAKYPAVAGRDIGALPTSVSSGTLPPPDRPWHAYLGIGDAQLLPVAIDMSEDCFLIAGPIRSGRSTAAVAIARSLALSPTPPRLWLVAGRRTPISTEPWFERVLERAEDTVSALTELTEQIRTSGLDRGVCIVVDDATELVDTDADRLLAELTRLTRDHPVRLVMVGEAAAARRAYSGVFPEVRKLRNGLLLQPDLDLDGDLLGARLPRRTRLRFVAGRGFLVQRDEIQLVQVAN